MKDIAQQVNAFMNNDAPSMHEAGKIQYDMLEVVAKQLIFTLKTTKEHAIYVMNVKYGHCFAQDLIRSLVEDIIKADTFEKLVPRIKKQKPYKIYTQPSLL